MSELTVHLDEEIRELLGEIAGDPESTLFKLVPAEVVTNAYADVPSASAGTAGWTAAERHLLQAYRDEVALLLQNAFRAKGARGDGQCRALVGGYGSTQKPPRHTSDAEQSIREARRLTARSHYDASVAGLLGRIAVGSLGEVGYGELALAARRLQGSAVSRVLHAQAHLFEGRPSAGRDLLGQLEAEVAGDLRFYVLTTLAMAQGDLGDCRSALEVYSAALDERPDNITTAASCLKNALQLQDRGARDRFALRLDELATDRPVEAARFATLWSRVRPLHSLTLDPQGEWIERLGMSARRIVDAGL